MNVRLLEMLNTRSFVYGATLSDSTGGNIIIDPSSCVYVQPMQNVREYNLIRGKADKKAFQMGLNHFSIVLRRSSENCSRRQQGRTKTSGLVPANACVRERGIQKRGSSAFFLQRFCHMLFVIIFPMSFHSTARATVGGNI